MKKIILLICSFCIMLSTSAQLSRVMFISGGFSFLSDTYMSNTNLIDNNDGISQESLQYLQWNFVSGKMGIRVLLIPFAKNVSLSASATPTVSVGAMYTAHDLGTRYGLNASVPMLLEFNYGAASRYIASKNWGLSVGVGYEYFYSPICSYGVTETNYENENFTDSWLLPTAKLGIRYWSKKNKVNEVNLLVGFGEKQEDFYTFDGKVSKQYRPMHVGLSFMKIFNY